MIEYLYMALAAVAGIIGIFFYGKNRGKSQQKQETDTQVAKQNEKSQAVKSEVKNEISKKSDADVIDELSRDWLRNKDTESRK